MSKSPIDRYALKSFWYFVRRHPFNIFITATFFLTSSIALSLIPVFIGKLTGSLSAAPIDKDAAILYTIVLIVLSSGHDLLWRAAELVFLRYIRPLSFEYESMLFEKIIRKPYPYFVDKFTGKIAAYVSTIGDEMKELLDNMFYNYIPQAVGIIVFAIILSSINWQTGLIFFAGAAGMLFFGRRALKNSFGKEQLAADTVSTKKGKIVDIVSNFLNIKSFKTESKEIVVVWNEQSKVLHADKKSYIAGVTFWAVMSVFVRHLIWPITISLNVYLFFQGQLSMTQFATMLSAILLFSTTVWDTLWEITQFNLKLARAEEAHKYLFGQKTIRFSAIAKQKVAAPEFVSLFTIDKLDFAYPDKLDTLVLKNINLHIKKGEKIGIVGKSGSGKTTLTKLLLDYYPAQENVLLIDEKPVSSEKVAQLISYVPQDTSLFHRTIAENIAYATQRKVSRDEITKAAKQAHAHEFIKEISEGYDALVGERGVKLSAGQRQRIAIARAFLDDKPILILDEATSALDSESEILVQKALENLWDNKTVVAIAHRLSTLRQMDRIIVMDQGSIIEEGTHEQLLRKKGKYAQLWNHQSGGFIDEE